MEALSCEVSVTPNSRLLALIGQALKFQHYQGFIGTGPLPTSAAPTVTSLDLFRDSRAGSNKKKDLDEQLVKRQMGNITFTVESHPEMVLFSPDGSSTLVTGSVDGFIEVWEIENCKLRKDLEYQARDELMMHTANVNGTVTPVAIICGTFSADGEHLATGSQDGQIKVWKLSTGVCLKKILHAHSGGITSISFNRDNSQVLTTSFDNLARVFGLKSGKMLREFRGHSSFVNCGMITKDNLHVFTGSSDGTCRLWDSQTTECLFTFRPGVPVGSAITDAAVHTLISMAHSPATQDQVIVCSKQPQAHLITVQGKILRSFSSGKQSGGNFTCAVTSHRGKWLYCAGEDGVVYMFNVATGVLENIMEAIGPPIPPPVTSTTGAALPMKQNANAHTMALNRAKPDREIIGIAHHAQRNVIATITDDGKLTLWKP